MEETNNEIIFMTKEDKKIRMKVNNIDLSIKKIKNWINEDSNVEKYKNKISNRLPDKLDIMLHKEVNDVLKLLLKINQ